MTDEYIPGTTVNKASTLCSYMEEAQGKCYYRTREHTRPIHLNIPQPAVKTPNPSCIPKPQPQPKILPQPKWPKQYIPLSLKHLPCIPTAIYPGLYIPANLYPKLTLPPHMSSNCYNTFPPSLGLCLGPPINVIPWHSSFPQELIQHLLPHALHWRRFRLRVLTQLWQSQVPQHPVTPATQCPAVTPLPIVPPPLHLQESWGQGCPSPTTRQPWGNCKEDHRWGCSTASQSPSPLKWWGVTNRLQPRWHEGRVTNDANYCRSWGQFSLQPQEESPATTPEARLPSQTRGGVTHEEDVQLPLTTKAAGVPNCTEDSPDQFPLRVKTSKQRWQCPRSKAKGHRGSNQRQYFN